MMHRGPGGSRTRSFSLLSLSLSYPFRFLFCFSLFFFPLFCISLSLFVWLFVCLALCLSISFSLCLLSVFQASHPTSTSLVDKERRICDIINLHLQSPYFHQFCIIDSTGTSMVVLTANLVLLLFNSPWFFPQRKPKGKCRL